jgi:hypothetical protein
MISRAMVSATPDIGFYEEHGSPTICSAYQELLDIKARDKKAYYRLVGRLQVVATASDIQAEADRDAFDRQLGIFYDYWYEHCMYYCLEPSGESSVRPLVLLCGNKGISPQSKLDAEAYRRRNRL